MAAFVFLISFILFLVPFGVVALLIVEQWLIFKKAGREGWEVLIPIYSNIVLLEITGLPMWYIALLFVPGANIYAMIKIYLELAYRFNKSSEFGIGIFFLTPIFLGFLAFDKKNKYNEPVSKFNCFCTKCGNKIDISDKFCVRCGNALNNEDKCLNCGNKINKKDKYCMNCGTKI